MDKPLASLIISVYNNLDALRLVLESVKIQTEKRVEVIVSEDAEHAHIKEYLKEIKDIPNLYHLTQPDLGWSKNKALNSAIRFSHTDYLIFIDGDCVLHPRFLEFHVKMAENDTILAGKRIKLDTISSNWLLSNPTKISAFQSYLYKNLFSLKSRGSLFIEEGFFINPNGLFGFIPKIRVMARLKGCNLSVPKDTIYKINGFDEDFTRPAIGEDIDITWRFIRAGYKIKSLRNLAVQYHLDHKENWNNQDENIKLMNENKSKDLFICKNGLVKL